ncbi:hypothetical protein INH39_22055 [Massilia violaceinigra]|uniref:DUF4178 domain-containing protein n=1 Tax=Massilia violaceinigra TaxID=2045208 RepID=A0ABY4A255_9BURK|nr:hypothetical protein [Massilia violaceinigra]UOD28134.1 hypothetical protein INH39_22055 [Massilia violaceinigra]
MEHPAAQALAASAGLVEPLVWLMRKQIVSADALAEAHDSLALAGDRDMLDQALEQYELFCMEANGVWLDLLVREGLVGAGERERVLQKIGFETPFTAPDAVLVRMVHRGLMPRKQFDALRLASGGSARRRAILDDAAASLPGDAPTPGAAVVRKAPRKRFWIWGELALWILAPVLLAFGIGMITRALNALPACDGWTVGRQIRALTPPGAARSLTDIREIGYIEAAQLRGCRATLSVDGKAAPFAYTVASDPKDDKLVVTPADPAIVQMRFGRLDANARPPDLTYPIPRTALESAMREGGRRASYGWSARFAPEPRSEIADLEPVEPCRALVVGVRYTCRLLIERKDPQRPGVVGASSLHQGEFTIEQGGYAGLWKAGADFQREYEAAIAAPYQAP